ncbi:hypothetical protein N431DRAFT_495821 [Stipitochalara longipes BDJ]|nr:hypothetical protein N431DRAFT_495821 [Stipitochalara longipes BDJ]
MTDYSPLPPDTNVAREYLIPCGILVVVSMSLCTARIITRLRPSPHMHRDDYIIIILSFSEYVGVATAAGHGLGHRSPYVSQENRTIVFKTMFSVELMWITSLALVRTSVACSLLRLSRCARDSERLWKWCLRGLIGVQFLVFVGWMVLLFFNCRPLRATWEPVPIVKCWPNQYSIVFGYVANGIMIVMDFILATMPVQLIRTLPRPLRERVLISCLMAMGLLATGIAAYKIPLSREVNNGDPLSATVKLSLWNKLEEQLGLIAACLPCLKAQMEDLLHRLGILKTRMSHWSTFATSLKETSSSYPSSRQDSDEPKTEDTRHSSDAGLVSFATNTLATHHTRGTFKSNAESSVFESRDWDV